MNFPFSTQPGVLPLSIMHTLPQITQPEDSDFPGVTREQWRGWVLSIWPFPCRVGSNILVIFSVNTQMIWVTLGSFFDNMGCNFRIISLLLGFIQEGGKSYKKAIFCLFCIPEDPCVGFSTLPCLYCFFFSFPKKNGSHKPATIYWQLATWAKGWVYVISCNLLTK